MRYISKDDLEIFVNDGLTITEMADLLDEDWNTVKRYLLKYRLIPTSTSQELTHKLKKLDRPLTNRESYGIFYQGGGYD